MKEVVVISGKGGTGKTSLSAAFVALNSNESVACDCDVDAANLYILLGADFNNEEQFQSGHEAVIDQELCRACGKCMRTCHFGAIGFKDGKYEVNPLLCEGCHLCATVCRIEAIHMEPRIAGKSYISRTNFGNSIVHAELAPTAENSGKLVSHVKSRAKDEAKKESAKYILVDGSPGVGCSVIASVSGADLVAIVAEGSVSGLHDLKRVHQLCKDFKLKCVALINKWDLNMDASSEIEKYLNEQNVPLVGKIPYSKEFWESLKENKTLIENPNFKGEIASMWQKIDSYM